MAAAEVKTKKTNASVEGFLDSIADEKKRAEGYELLAMFKKLTKAPPKIWGSSIVGFGDWHYKSAKTGREGDWFLAGFSPRKAALTLYLGTGLEEFAPLLKRLGKHKTGMGCLYINKLADVDKSVLQEMIKLSLRPKPELVQ